MAITGNAQTPPAGRAFWNVTGQYAGAKQCVVCHPSQARHFHENSMSRALEKVSDSAFLSADIHYTWRDGGYSYSIFRSGDKVMYRVTNAGESFETPLEYAFGQGKAGQTYVYSVGGVFYESRVSYY